MPSYWSSLRTWRDTYKAFEGWAVELFVLMSMALLLLANLFGPNHLAMAWILSGVGLWRLSDIVATQVGIVIRDRQLPNGSVISLSRSVLLGLVNLLEVIFIFALLDKAIVITTGQVFLGPPHLQIRPSTRVGFLYLSWTTLLTLGSGFTPSTWPAQLAVMGEIGVGLLIIAVTLSVFVSGIGIPESPARRRFGNARGMRYRVHGRGVRRTRGFLK